MTQAQGPFAQLPYSLWTFPGLSIYERWLAATIIRLCWRPGPQPFSYQRLAKESGLTPGALCTKGEGEKEREGMIPHLEREGLVKVYRPVNAEGQVIRGKAFLIEPTEKLWQINATLPQSVYPVNSLQQKEGVCSMGETVYKESTPVYPVNTVLSPVNTPVYDVNTEEGVTQGQKCDEKPPIYIDKEDSNISLVTSASAESDGGASFLSQFEETLQEVQNGQTPLDVSCSPEGHSQEEPGKLAGTSKEPATTSAVHDTTSDVKALQEIPNEKPLFPAAQPPHNSKTHKKDNRKISVLSVPKVPPRVIREAIDAIRGYALDQEGPIKHQGVILKEWCQKHTLEDFQHVIEHLTKGRCSNEKHQWWREKNHMKTFFNAAKLAELTPDILSELGHIPKPEAPPEVAPVEEPKIVGWTPVRRIYPPKGETVTYG